MKNWKMTKTQILKLFTAGVPLIWDDPAVEEYGNCKVTLQINEIHWITEEMALINYGANSEAEVPLWEIKQKPYSKKKQLGLYLEKQL